MHSILVNPSLVIRKIYWRSVKNGFFFSRTCRRFVYHYIKKSKGWNFPYQKVRVNGRNLFGKNKVGHVVYRSGLNQLSSALRIKLLCRLLKQNWKLKAYNWKSCNSYFLVWVLTMGISLDLVPTAGNKTFRFPCAVRTSLDTPPLINCDAFFISEFLTMFCAVTQDICLIVWNTKTGNTFRCNSMDRFIDLNSSWFIVKNISYSLHCHVNNSICSVRKRI